MAGGSGVVEEEEKVSKVVKEYPLPACSQTHEVVKIGEELLVLSQQPSGSLVKVKLEASTGRPLAAKKFIIGESSCSGLHGLFASKSHPGKVWATLQFQSELLLLDPVANALQKAPTVVKSIQLSGAPTKAGWGPHTLVEDGDHLWVACKGSNYILLISHKTSSILAKFQCSSRPIFVAVHPTSGHVYSSLDLSSKILHIDNLSSESLPKEIDVPATHGNTPVGLVAGPDGNVWFVLLGDSSGGTGTFARISSDGTITWFQLTSTAGASAGLIHLTFDTSYDKTTGGPLRVWLLASSMASTTSINAIFSVTLDGDPIRIVSEETILMPTPFCMTHRVLRNGTGLFVTELGVSVLAHVKGDALWNDLVCETSDPYSLWGFGCAGDDIEYVSSTTTTYVALVSENKRPRR